MYTGKDGRGINRSTTLQRRLQASDAPLIEVLEDRRLLSASVVHHTVHAHTVHHTAVKHAKVAKTATTIATTAATTASTGTTTTTTTSGAVDVETNDRFGRTILFSQAPAKVQAELTSLAAAHSLAAPTASQTVFLGNSDGIESYSIDVTSAGIDTRLTSDVNGNPVTAPTSTTSTWATLSGTGAGSDAAAAAEIGAIASALRLTAPTSTTQVAVRTTSAGVTLYTVDLADANGQTRRVSVDADGNPAGTQELPFSALPAAIQQGINSHLPAGVTALATTSTQTVDVRTSSGLTTYSTVFTATGISSTVTVDKNGAPASLPSQSTVTFSTIPQAAQTELQALATADGITTPIATSQSVSAFNEGNGTTIYTVALTDTTTSQTINVTISVDQAGNPTVPPRGGREGCGDGGGSGGGNTDGGGDENGSDLVTSAGEEFGHRGLFFG